MPHSNKILNYSDYLTDNISWASENKHLFFRKVGHCPNCDKKAQLIIEKFHEDIVEDDSAACTYYSVQVHQCSCGWWDLIDHYNTGSDSADPCLDWDTAHRGILRTFDSNDLEIPITVLSEEIRKHPKIIDHIHHYKKEDLIGNVLSNFYPGCSIEKFGSHRTHDGGFDGYMILHEKKYGIQVKRHHARNIKKGEPVSAIRELVGAMTIQQIPNAIYVTNATHFSYTSTKEAKEALKTENINKIELIDRDRLFSMLELYASQQNEVWLELLPNWAQELL